MILTEPSDSDYESEDSSYAESSESDYDSKSGSEE